MTGKDVKFQ